jgi:hypothetical protein
MIVNAPTFGKAVQLQDLRGFGDYVGASRSEDIAATSVGSQD